MQKTDVTELIRRQRAVVSIIAVGGYQSIFQGGHRAYRYYHGRMLEILTLKGELHDVAGTQVFQLTGFPDRPDGNTFPRQEIPKVHDPCPGGGFLVGVDVVPAEGGREVHHAAAGVNALGGEVGAVAP